MNEQRVVVTVEEVGAAFERLVAHVLAAPCDPEYARTIHMAGVDVLAILRGEWDVVCPLCGRLLDGLRCGDCDVTFQSAEDVERTRSDVAVGYYRQMEGTADEGRCPSCDQTLDDIHRSMFACPSCYAAFGDEAIEAARAL